MKKKKKKKKNGNSQAKYATSTSKLYLGTVLRYMYLDTNQLKSVRNSSSIS